MERWSWLGDQLAIDLANTVRRRGDRYVDFIAEPEGVREWLAAEAGRVPPVPVDDGAVRAVGDLRDDVLAVLRAAARGESWPKDAVGRLNELLARRPVVRLLRPEARGAEVRVAGDGPPLSALLATVAAEVVELLAGPDADRLALCDAPGCGQLYLRDRRNQRWCGDACGTRARVVRHQRRVAGRASA
ncbi:hypothetical protein E1262_17795 [Jiangella aurantiaca]|uniref:Zinc finger CGNR domain-containing protein n=1 Tax=Jiangella aurantiaca TaxID=2530373 RepID=A0A4R5ADD2_9ACTN|nr:ABATE domain-containing protein [Jiangella aurantiaca]TDD67862.1 hypothetical protein E1262_17795 [Jiangella aurantiaca]